MIATITKEFTFSASHELSGLPEGHQCARLHGHNYVVRVEVEGTVDPETGFVYDYGDLKPFGVYLDSQLDHRHLNDALPSSPTAENLARFLTHKLRRVIHDHAASAWHPLVVAIHVSETPKTWATYREKW